MAGSLSWFKKIVKKFLKPRLDFSNAVSGWFGGVFWTDPSREQFIKEGYIKNAGVYSVVSYIADLASIAPFRVYRIKDQKKHRQFKAWTGKGATMESIAKAMRIKELAYEEDTNHELNKLIERPNPMQGQQQFTANSVGFRLLTGERFLLLTVLEMGANEGKPFSIYNLPSQYMQIRGDGTLFGIAGYELTIGGVSSIPKEQIIFNKMWNPDFGVQGEHLRGLSPLKAAMRSIDRGNSAVDRSVSYLQNAGANGLAYVKDNEGGDGVSLEVANDLKYKFNNEVLGTGNSGKIAVAQGDWGFLNFGYNTKDLAIEELERLSLEDVCNVFHFPSGLLRGDKTYNNAKEFKKEAITMAVVPQLSSLRDDWNEIAKLYGEEIYVDYDLSVYPEMQENLKETAEFLNLCYFFTPNEKRIMMGHDEDPDNEALEKYYVPNNLVPIDELSIQDDVAEFDRTNDALRAGNVQPKKTQG